MRASLTTWRSIRCCGWLHPLVRLCRAHSTGPPFFAARSSTVRTTPPLIESAYSSLHRASSTSHGYFIAAGHDSSIYALSTAAGRSAIAIIRVSGPASLDIYRALCPSQKDPEPRYATVRSLYEPQTGKVQGGVLDVSALIIYFPSPRTATGEDVLELHVHGGPAIVKAVLSAIPKCSTTHGDIRYAEPGEFTRRAFMNNRLDLTQVEALGDSLAAFTEQQRRLSVRAAGGQLAKQYELWRQNLLHARGELEALIDFSEDQHFDESPADLCGNVAAQVWSLSRKLQAHRENVVRAELLRNGISVSLLGAPNAGKSSLLNHVVGREAAIVSQEAGTTRDVIEVGLDLGGYYCRLGDTAGLRGALQGEGANDHKVHTSASVGHIEREGMRRAKERAADSDVVIVLLPISPAGILDLDSEVVATASALIREKGNVVVAINKIDNVASSAELDAAVSATLVALPGLAIDRIHLISCKAAQKQVACDSINEPPANAGAAGVVRGNEADPTTPSPKADPGGMQAFLRGLVNCFEELTAAVVTDATEGGAEAAGGHDDPSVWQESLGASLRHRLLLDRCHGHLIGFLDEAALPQYRPASASSGVAWSSSCGVDEDVDSYAHDTDIVLAAEHLRAAADCLAKITGRGGAGDVEEVLGVVFEKFCVGK